MSFTHLDDSGHARMVDVTAKQPTVRAATARGFVRCSPEVVAALRDGTVPKGDVLAVARIAGIQGAKRTPDLLPLAHVIGVHGAVVDLAVVGPRGALAARSRRLCAPPIAPESRWKPSPPCRSRPSRSSTW